MTRHTIPAEGKAFNHVTLISACRDHLGAPAEFLLMPSQEGFDSRLVRSAFPKAHIQGVERDRKIAAHQHAHARALGVDSVFVGTVAEYLDHAAQHRAVPFDVAFLDYMGLMSANHVRDIARFVRDFAAPQCVLATTFMHPSRQTRLMEEMRDLVTRLVPLHPPLGTTAWPLTGEGAEPWREPRTVYTAIAGAIRHALHPNCKIKLVEAQQYHSGPTQMYFGILAIDRGTDTTAVRRPRARAPAART